MAKDTPIQNTFDGGVLSPLLAGRTDLVKYFNGCAVLENFLPSVQGPLVRRGGTQYIFGIKSGAVRSWLIRFQVSERVSYMLEFGHLYVRFYTNRGLLVVGGSPVEVSTPYTAADLTAEDGTCNLRVVQSADTMYIFHRLYQTRKLLRLSATSFSMVLADFTEGPFDDVNSNEGITVTTNAEVGAVTLTASAGIFLPAHVGTLFYLETADLSAVKPWGVYQEVNIGTRRRVDNRVYQCTTVGPVNSEGPPVTGNQTPIHTEGRAWDGDGQPVEDDQRGSIGVEWEFLHAGYGIVRIEGYVDAQHVTGTIVKRLPTELQPGGGSSTVVTSYPISSMTLSTSSPSRSFVSASGHPFADLDAVVIGGTNLKDADGVLPDITRDGSYVVRDRVSAGFDIDAPFPSTGAYAYDPLASGIATRTTTTNYGSHTPSWKWAFSLFSDVNGWPEHGAFWRQRLVLMAGRVGAMSVTSDFENFAAKAPGGEQETDSSIVFRLNARQINRAVWLVESDNLIIGTDGDEWIVGPIQANQALGPANIRAERRTAYGSRSIQPVEVGGRVLFIQASGRKLRDYEYSYDTNNYASSDTTKLASNVLLSGVVDLAYQQEPDSIIWAARADGRLVGCTYDQEAGRSDVYAWHPHPMVNGFVEAVETMPSPDGSADDLWMIVRRQVSGQTVRYVEILRAPLKEEEAQAEAFYVDSGLTYRGTTTDHVTGLEHLEGQEVDILTNGAAHPRRTVVAGRVDLQFPAEVIHVGLPTSCAVATMSLEAGSASGTAQGKLKRITNLIVRMYRSLGGNVGPARDKTNTLNFRRPSQPMGSAPPLLTGDSDPIPWPGGYERGAQIWYTNEQPLPVTLVALMPVVGTSDDR
ncbi:hypothetical protein [Achromobacter marplatensis]|jgi:hypothetical protein|uniref:hypothetical protein n=1 Tax=Achromobacter marplatensis TaxID=470868 RepID=UPI003CFF8E37